MTSTAPSLLVLDAGTSTVRAALFREGRLAAEARRPVSLVFPAPGRAEQDPRELWESSASALETVASSLRTGERAAIGVTNQRSTVVLWDAATSRPLGPALSWRDSRALAEARALASDVPDILRRTGLPASPHYGAAKLTWALGAWPEARALADAGELRVGSLSAWLTWKLTRGESHAIDPTNAQRLQLMDLHALDWDPDLVRASGVPAVSLPRILPTDGYFGDAHVAGRTFPVRAVLGDQQAALLGLAAGPRREDTAGVQLGTGGFVLKDTGPECVQAPGLLSGLARADANQSRRYLVEGTVNSAGSALDRLREIGLLREDEDVDALCDAAQAPVVVVPAWAGLGAPWWEPRAKGALLGWDESATRADFVAGTIQGVSFLVADVVDAMAAAGLDVSHLDLSGPVSRLATLAQAIADATRLPLHVRTNPEASLEGIAAALASACGGIAPSLSVQLGRAFGPQRDRSAAREAFAAARQAAIALARTDG